MNTNYYVSNNYGTLQKKLSPVLMVDDTFTIKKKMSPVLTIEKVGECGCKKLSPRSMDYKVAENHQWNLKSSCGDKFVVTQKPLYNAKEWTVKPKDAVCDLRNKEWTVKKKY